MRGKVAVACESAKTRAHKLLSHGLKIGVAHAELPSFSSRTTDVSAVVCRNQPVTSREHGK